MIINNKIYALYKGEEYITSGTIYEIAEQLHKTRNAILIYKTPTYKKRKHINCYELFELEDKDETEEEQGSLRMGRNN